MARSGAFTRSKGKRKKNPLTYGLDGVVNITDTYERSVASSRGLAEHYANQLRMRGRDDIVYVVFGITPEAKAQAGRLRNGMTITLSPRDYEIAYAFHPTRGEISRELKAQRDAERRAYVRRGMTLKNNPAKKTVSQKISQLTREGYPQQQAVAIALSEERTGKVKRNPAPRGFVKADDYTVEVFNKYGMKPYDAVYMQTKGGRGEPTYDLTVLKHENGKYLAAHGSVIVKQQFDRASDAAAYLEEWYINNRQSAYKRNPSDYRFEIRRANKAQTLDSVYTTLTQAKNALDEIDRPPASFFLVDTQTGKHYFSFQAETKLPMIELRATAMQKAYKRNPRASNPAKRLTYQYALVIDDGGFSFGMDQITPVQFTFSAQDKKRGVYRSFKLPAEVIKNPEFQAWATQLPGHSIVISLRDLRSLIKQYFVQ